MAWIALSAVEVDGLRGLLAHAGEVLTVEVVDRLRRRFGDASPVEQTRDGLGRWAARLATRQARRPDRSVRLDAGEVDGLTRLLGGAHLWLAALDRVRWPQAAAGLPGRLAQVREGLQALLAQAHAGPGPPGDHPRHPGRPRPAGAGSGGGWSPVRLTPPDTC